MNVDTDRPYVCTAPGCSQRFQREDHLIIHRHKHEMTLKFSSIKCDNTLSDQTPTPTRFLRDCEEVGLFTDLELNQSPAVEENKPNFSMHVSGPAAPHTESQSDPHHFQHQQPCALAHLNQSQCTNTFATSNKQSVSSCLHSRQTPVTNSMPGTLSSINMEAQMNSSMIGIPGPAHSGSCPSLQRSKVISSLAASNGGQNPLCHMMEMMSSHQHPLSHLHSASHHHPHRLHHHHHHHPHPYQQHRHNQSPQRLAHHHPHQESSLHIHAHHSPQPGPAHQNAPPLSHQPLPSQMSSSPKPPPSPQSPSPPTGGRRRRSAEEDPDERRRKFLERNRAAATRCRQKRKVWVSSLERKAEELTHTNVQLQNEVTTLRTEVTQLKQILLTHKDCPVSVRQRETQGGTGSPAGSPVQQLAIQHNSISTSTRLKSHPLPANAAASL